MRRQQQTIVLLVIAAAWYWPPPAVGHVALTFPPARQYDLDFLDSTRTRPPCGMPKGKCYTTSAFCCCFDWSVVSPLVVLPGNGG
jgi:hypothetical protein